MGCECTTTAAKTETERKALKLAFVLNATMFVVGTAAGIIGQSTGLLADALDMLADASAYALALVAVSRGPVFKQNAARWTGATLLLLGAGIIAEVLRRWIYGSEPVGPVMAVVSLLSFCVNVAVLRLLARFRDGEVHLRAIWICTRADVLANIGVFLSGLLVWGGGFRVADLVVGLVIGIYVLREAVEIFRDAGMEPEAG